jgi:hypothetical protein
MSIPKSSILLVLKTIAVFIVSTSIAFFVFLYAILYLGLPIIPLLPVINFDQLASAFIYAILLSVLIATVYYCLRR